MGGSGAGSRLDPAPSVFIQPSSGRFAVRQVHTQVNSQEYVLGAQRIDGKAACGPLLASRPCWGDLLGRWEGLGRPQNGHSSNPPPRRTGSRGAPERHPSRSPLQRARASCCECADNPRCRRPAVGLDRAAEHRSPPRHHCRGPPLQPLMCRMLKAAAPAISAAVDVLRCRKRAPICRKKVLVAPLPISNRAATNLQNLRDRQNRLAVEARCRPVGHPQLQSRETAFDSPSRIAGF